jgi:HJR/Mrr/RecB family endonuclease
MLLKVMKKNGFILDDLECRFISWMLIRVIAIKYFSEIWEREHGQHFTNIKDLSLQQCIEIYFSIDTIQPDFIENIGMLTYYLMHKGKFNKNNNFIFSNEIVITEIQKNIEEIRINQFEKNLDKKQKYVQFTINDIDLMGGIEFENLISLLFSKMGYVTKVTKSSGDQGVDIIAEKNGHKIGIQAKCYAKAVNNSAIQEVVAGIRHYQLDKTIVVTNNYFTKSAQELAKINGVILWDRTILSAKLEDIFA